MQPPQESKRDLKCYGHRTPRLSFYILVVSHYGGGLSCRVSFEAHAMNQVMEQIQQKEKNKYIFQPNALTVCWSADEPLGQS